ncbi:MAG: alpha/beta hydrolase [Opitutae bacterium]|nr:alpha/beta hydrolase [Opitutae bacterium]
MHNAPTTIHRRTHFAPAALFFGLFVGFLPLTVPSWAAEPGKRPAGAIPPAVAEKFQIERDVVYAEPAGHPQKLDLFVPKSGAGPFPLIVWIHGGGWQNGSKANPGGALRLSGGDYAVASIDYRLTHVAIFPAQIEDCKAAIRWLRTHAAQYRLDPERIGVWGSSAGGHLVALLGVTGETKEFDVGAHLDVYSRVQAVCDYYGPADLTRFGGGEYMSRPDSPEAKLLGGQPQENLEKAKRASPIAYVASTAAPMLIVHGTADPVVPVAQSQWFYDALKAAKADAQLHLIPNAKHGGPEFGTPEVTGKIRAFFDLHLRPKSAKH